MHRTLLTSAVALSAAAFLFSASPAALAAGSDPHATVSAAPDHQNLTIYPNFGIVQQTNPVDVAPGANSIRLDGIAGQYEPSSLVIVNVNGIQIKVKDVSFEPANTNALAASVGSTITLKTPAGDEVTGKVLSYTDGTLYLQPAQGPSGFRMVKDAKDVQFVSIPSGLSFSPSLTLNADATAGGHGQLQILYKANGLSWAGRYAITYNEQKSTVDVSSSVAINNRSGVTYKNAGVKVVSGDIRESHGFEEKALRAAPMAAAAPGGGASFDNAEVGSLGEAKIYTLSTTGVDLKDSETKQVPLFTTQGVPVERVYYMRNPHNGGDNKVSANVRLISTNDKAHHLGQPLPNGSVKYYQTDPSGDLQLSAAGSLPASEPGDKLTFELGTTNDVKSTWSQTRVIEGKRQSDGSYTPSTYDWSAKFTNSKDHDVTVKVYDYTGRVKVTQSSQPFSPEGGQQYTTVRVPAHGSATLTYTTVEQY